MFYENLYQKKETLERYNLAEKLKHYKVKKLTDQESNNLEGPVTKAEILKTLKQMKNDKSPGADGFTVEFFKFFWADLGEYITRSINDSYNKGEFTNTQKLGIITCIPKPDKNETTFKELEIYYTPLSNLQNCFRLYRRKVKNKTAYNNK